LRYLSVPQTHLWQSIMVKSPYGLQPTYWLDGEICLAEYGLQK
jgi:hypothetical protein